MYDFSILGKDKTYLTEKGGEGERGVILFMVNSFYEDGALKIFLFELQHQFT